MTVQKAIKAEMRKGPGKIRPYISKYQEETIENELIKKVSIW